MGKELATFDFSQLPVASEDASDFESVAESVDYIKRLQLASSGKLVNKAKITPGNYCIPGSDDKAEDLGNSVDVYVLSRKFKALDTSDRKAIVEVNDRNSEVFQDIKARSGKRNSQCMWGISYLVYERSTKQFLEFFCGTKTLRGMTDEINSFMPLSQAQIDVRVKALEAQGKKAPSVKPHGPIPMNLTSRSAENNDGNIWQAPVLAKSTVPFDLPAGESILEKATQFLAVEAEPEKIESGRAR